MADILLRAFNVKKRYGPRKYVRTEQQARELLTSWHGEWEALGSGKICSHKLTAKPSSKTEGLFVSCSSITRDVTSITCMFHQENQDLAVYDRMNKPNPPYIENYDAICLGVSVYKRQKRMFSCATAMVRSSRRWGSTGIWTALT